MQRSLPRLQVFTARDAESHSCLWLFTQNDVYKLFPQTMNSFERRAHQLGYRSIAGIDEVGRGPLAGPVVAAAVILPPNYKNREIKDSKQLPARKRENLSEIIRQDALSVGLGVVEASIIDEVNIFQAALAAMKEAALNLSLTPDYLLIDGPHRIFVSIPAGTDRQRRLAERLYRIGLYYR